MLRLVGSRRRCRLLKVPDIRPSSLLSHVTHLNRTSAPIPMYCCLLESAVPIDSGLGGVMQTVASSLALARVLAFDEQVKREKHHRPHRRDHVD